MVKFAQRNWIWIVLMLVAFVVGFFACNAYLRWAGIETELFGRKDDEMLLSNSSVSLCDGIKHREKVLEWTQCGIDSCSHTYYDLQGNLIGEAGTGMTSMAEKGIGPEDHVIRCQETTEEYFYRFVPRKR